MNILFLFDISLAAVVVTDTSVEAIKYYRKNKFMVKWLFETYPYRIAALSLWLMKVIYVTYIR